MPLSPLGLPHRPTFGKLGKRGDIYKAIARYQQPHLERLINGRVRVYISPEKTMQEVDKQNPYHPD
jgi:hypothetical protein